MSTIDLIVSDPGDPSVGIPERVWVIEELLDTDDAEDLLPDYREQMRADFRRAFDWLGQGKLRVVFSDELPQVPEIDSESREAAHG